jgi:hypothetical protein
MSRKPIVGRHTKSYKLYVHVNGYSETGYNVHSYVFICNFTELTLSVPLLSAEEMPSFVLYVSTADYYFIISKGIAQWYSTGLRAG